jgi:hypothetical protein
VESPDRQNRSTGVRPGIADPRHPRQAHATSTLDALASNAAQLQTCARRVASDLLADLEHVETTLLKPDGTILSGRLDPAARQNLELCMRDAGLPIAE